MTTEFQNRAWSVLPKEFKEGVRKEYRQLLNSTWQLPHKGYLRERLRMLRELFGEHNLTSDAEGEEMLYCDKSIVQDMANTAIRSIQIHDYEGNTIASQNLATFNRGVKFALETLYGSKCLPDIQASYRQVKEPNGTIVGIIDDTKGPDYSNATKIGIDCNDDSAHHFADAGKMVDHIADVSNMIPARLHIAAMAMQGMLSNPEFGKKYLGYLHCCHKGDDVIDETLYYAQKALNLADTLIVESEKKGGDK